MREDRPVYGLFNAWHDEALAADIPNFTPTAAARAISRDLALLPFWSSACGSAVVADTEECARFIASLPLLERGGRLAASLPATAGGIVEPWGWDKPVLRSLQKAGIEPRADGGHIAMLRRLQNRLTSSRLLPTLLEALRESEALRGVEFTGHSRFAHSPAEVRAAIADGGQYMLKRPLSGSGRGLLAVGGGRLNAREAAWAEAACRRCGGLEVQRRCDVVMNFALEFHKPLDGGFRFTGCSEFASARGGAYGGNYLSAGSRRGADVCRAAGISAAQFEAFVEIVAGEMNRLAPGYHGPAGIDMMLCRSGAGVAVFPCVEINFRHTMGMLANSLGITPDAGCHAWFRIARAGRDGEMLERTRRAAAANPPVKSRSHRGGESFLAGYLPLTPVGEATRFHAYLLFAYGAGCGL